VTTLYKADLHHLRGVGTEDERNQLKQDILKLKEQAPNLKLSNEGCWRGANFIVEEYPWLESALRELIYTAHTQYISEDLTYNDYAKLDGTAVTGWVNVNEPNSRNVIHTHYATYSAVFYLQSTGTGKLRFCNPQLVMSNDKTDSPFSRDFFIDPLDGDFFLWPSWVPHEVEPNLSNKQRINIAFDIYLNTGHLINDKPFEEG
jgi:uncharacterized protein (TIGR02466 family)